MVRHQHRFTVLDGGAGKKPRKRPEEYPLVCSCGSNEWRWITKGSVVRSGKVAGGRRHRKCDSCGKLF